MHAYAVIERSSYVSVDDVSDFYILPFPFRLLCEILAVEVVTVSSRS